MGEVTFLEVARALHSARWTFAKTMPHNPHEWTLRRHWPGRVPFDTVVAYIRERGYTMKFGRRDYRCLDVNGFRYWTMGAAYEETILINRAANQAREADYDALAPTYDEIYDTDEARDEDAAIMSVVANKAFRTVLDVGCGTGLFLRYNKIEPQNYFGLDPSAGMIERARQAFPVYRDRLQPWRFEEFWNGEPVDLAVSLFGTASYIEPVALARVPELAKRWIFMFYRPGYKPACHGPVGISPVAREWGPWVERVLPGKATEFVNWIIVEGEK